MLFLTVGEHNAPEKAAAALREKGAVLIVPTETVYGLVCPWDDSEARAKIYALKHRSETKLFAAFVPDVACAETLAGIPLPPAARKLALRFMPGPITLVVPDKNGKTFGFRIPDHPFIQALLNVYRGALASTSANLSGQPPALDMASAVSAIDGAPAAAVDGGPLPKDSVPSTVILVSADNSLRILRQGLVREEQIRKTAYDIE